MRTKENGITEKELENTSIWKERRRGQGRTGQVSHGGSREGKGGET